MRTTMGVYNVRTCGRNSIVVLALFSATVTATSTNPKKILTVGDSWAAYSGNSFSKFCDCAVQIQRGIGGTTAAGWTTGRSSLGDTNFATALTAAGALNSNDVIVLSVGGNDWIGLDPPCQGKNLAQLQAEIQGAVNALISNVTATGCGTDCPSIWTFGYATVTSGTDGCADNLPAARVLNTAIVNVAAATAQLNHHDITTLCGGSATTLSPADPCFGMTYAHDGSADNIHMNQRGYCMMVTQPAVQTAFGCKSQTLDCTTVDKDLNKVVRNAEVCAAFSSCSTVNSTCPAPSATTDSTTTSASRPRRDIGISFFALLSFWVFNLAL